MDTKTSDRNGHFPHNFLYESKTHSSYTRVVLRPFRFHTKPDNYTEKGNVGCHSDPVREELFYKD